MTTSSMLASGGFELGSVTQQGHADLGDPAAWVRGFSRESGALGELHRQALTHIAQPYAVATRDRARRDGVDYPQHQVFTADRRLYPDLHRPVVACAPVHDGILDERLQNQ